jgi:hypothetical protein
MPTAAKLFGLILYFGIGWMAAGFVVDTFPEGMVLTWFPLTIALIGAWQGWMVAGGNAGKGIGMAFANGIRASVQLAFFGLLLFSLYTMFQRAARLRYDGAGEAVIATLELFLEYFLQSLTVPIWGILLVGGAIAGLIVETVSRIWR